MTVAELVRFLSDKMSNGELRGELRGIIFDTESQFYVPTELYGDVDSGENVLMSLAIEADH